MLIQTAHTTWRPQPQQAAAQKAAPAQEAPSEQAPSDEKVVVNEHLTTDNAYSFYVNGERKMILKGQRESLSSKVIRQTRNLMSAAGSELGALASSNPAMAFNTTMEAIRPVVMDGIPSQFHGPTQEILLPVQRGVLVLFDAYKAYERWKQNRVLGDDAGAMDQIGMLVDGTHVATDVAGLLGSIGRYIPALAAISAVGLTIAIAGDMAAYSFNLVEYIDKRGKGAPPVPAPTPPPTAPAPPPTPAPPPPTNP